MKTNQKRPKLTSSQPPVIYQNGAQVSGIAQDYDLPGDMVAEDFDILVKDLLLPYSDSSPEMTGAVRHIFNKIAALNPAVAALPHDDNPKYLRHAIFGVSSSMNLDDIKFFIEQTKATNGGPIAYLVRQDRAYDEMCSFIEARTGVSPRWVPSPQTLMKICQQVASRPAKYPPQKPISPSPV